MIGSSAPAWAVWLALGLWAVAIVVGVVAFVLARRAWRQWSPQLTPYLSMLGLASVSAEPGTDTAAADSSPGSASTDELELDATA